MSSLKDRFSWREHEADRSLAGVGICTFLFAFLIKLIRFGLSSRVENLSENVQRGCCSALAN